MRWAQGTYLAGILAVLLPAVLYGQREREAVRADSDVLQVGFSENVFYDVNPKDAQAITNVSFAHFSRGDAELAAGS